MELRKLILSLFELFIGPIFFAAFGTCHKFAAPYHPATNVAAELANIILVLILRKMVDLSSLHWPRLLDSALMVYWISYLWIISLSPFKAQYSLTLISCLVYCILLIF